MKLVKKNRDCDIFLIENHDDLLALSILIKKEDIVNGVVYRKLEHRDEDVRKKKTERIMVRVKIRVEKVEIQEFSDRLRIHGVIIEGPEELIGSYQSINFEIGETIEICKNWDTFEKEYLQEILSENYMQSIVAVGIEQGYAEIYIIKNNSFERVYSRQWSSNKLSDQNEENYVFGEILSKIKDIYEDSKLAVIIYGPGFIKDNFIKFAEEKVPNLSFHVVTTNHGDLRGLYELIRGKLSSFIKNCRISKEMALLDKLMEEIGKNGLFAYGVEEIERYAACGAIEILLVHRNLFHEHKTRNIVKLVKDKGGRVCVISGEHEGGKILHSLGGLAAITRYKIN